MIYNLLSEEDKEKVDFKMQAYGDYKPSEMTSPELMAKKKELHAGAKDLLDRVDRFNRELTASEENEYDELLARLGRINQQIEFYQANNTEGPINLKSQPMGSSSHGSSESKIKMYNKNEPLYNTRPYVLPTGVQASQLDLGRWFKGIVTGDWTGAGAELNFRAAAGGSNDTLGGYLVPDPLSDQIIDLARNQTRVMQAGAGTVLMDSQNLTLATVENDPSAFWKEENALSSESDMTFGAIRLSAKTLVCMTRISLELVQDAPNLSSILQTAMASALALELDKAALMGAKNGSAQNWIVGLNGTDGVQEIDLGPNGLALSNYTNFSKAWQKIQEANGPEEGIAIINSPRTAGDIDRFADLNNNPLASPESWGKMNKFTTNQVPIDLAHGTADNTSIAFIGDFSQLIFGIRTNQLSLQFSEQAGEAFERLQVLVRVYLRADIAIMRPNHFVNITGILPTA